MRTKGSRTSIYRFTWRNIMILTVPLLTLMLFSLFSQLYYTRQYTAQMSNVTSASAFNQSFKENVDLKMYYYITGSRYSVGLPLSDVNDARELAQQLLSTTTARDSRKAISSVLELCDNLESKIILIAETESYDQQQEQLNNNIYVLTSLIEEYMYNYLYYESAQLSASHSAMVNQIQAELMLVFTAAVVVVALVAYQSQKFSSTLARPLVALADRVHEIGEGSLTAQSPVPSQVDEIGTLSEGFEQMVAQLREQIENRRLEQAQLHQTEFALLQAQINPHFLYNTLDTIIWLEEVGQTEKSIQMVTDLSSYFRTSLSNGRAIIALHEELTHIQSYLDIQQVRYRDILEYEIITSPEIAMVQIPKLTLQPLVENALYHGIKLKRGKGRICIRCAAEDGCIRITVSDNGAGMTPQRLEQLRCSLHGEEQTGFGFAAVHQRLRLLYGSPFGLWVDSTAGEGTTVEVLLPGTGKEALP